MFRKRRNKNMFGTYLENTEILDSTHDEYDVSICIVTYNHSNYIRETFKSIFMQKTKLSYEIVVGDDLSPDDTASILREYWEKHPDKVCLLLNKKNLGLSQNLYNVFSKAKGKYLIVLYGDDYWIDEEKLEMEYRFLEKNKKYIGVTTPIESIYDGETKPFRIIPMRFQWNKPNTLGKYLKGYDFPMAGVMFHADIFRNNREHFYKMIKACPTIDDASFCILLLMKGDVYIIGRVTAAYRCFRKEQEASNFNTINSVVQKSIKQVKLFNELDELLAYQYDLEMRYGLILASAFNAMRKQEISSKDYKLITSEIGARYKTKARRMLLKGIIKKIEVNNRKA